MKAREITVPTAMCDGNRRLSPDGVGWAKHPIIQCNVKGSPFRKKKWNYWCVTSPDLLLSATISHLDYAAVMFVYVLDLHTFKFQEKTVLAPLGIGCTMPDEVYASIRYETRDITISFEEQGDATRLFVRWSHFGGKDKPLLADMTIHRPEGHESLNVVVPWSDTRFQFTSKQNTLPTKGSVEWDGTVYNFDENSAFGCLDFGRGIWPYSSTWNWASASGNVGDRKVGLNFGGQWTDGTGQTENGIVIDGRLSKIHEDILWQYDRSDYMSPWTLTTANSDQVSLTFKPLFERVAATKAVIIRSEVHQMIGTFHGYIVTEEGERIEIDSLLGWAEDHSASW